MKIGSGLLSFFIMFSFSSAGAQMGLEGVSSGRYEVRKNSERSIASDKGEIILLKQKTNDSEKRADSKEPLKLDPKQFPSSLEKKENEPVEVGSVPHLGEQLKSIFNEDAARLNGYYLEKLAEEDPRKNRLELDLLPTVVGNRSISNYSFREYDESYNAFNINATMWLTPSVGFIGKYLFSLGADMDARTNDRSRIPTKFELMNLGISLRQFVDLSKSSDSLEFNVLYSENKTVVPSDAVSRLRLTTSGFGLGVKSRIYSTQNYSWIIGGSIFPRLRHLEDTTALLAKSGSNEESLSVGFEIGGVWIFQRDSQMVWSLSTAIERNTFSGLATVADIKTGQTPTNVSVTNTIQMFSLGYRWGR